MKSKLLLQWWGLLLVGILSGLSTPYLTAQSCDCTEYVYVNERAEGKVHKFAVETDGSLTEINPTGPWYPNGGTSELPSPHGLGTDLNGFIYIAEDWDDPTADIRKLRCDGTIFPESDFQLNAQAFNITSIGNTLLYNQPGGGTGPGFALDWTSIEGYNLCEGTSAGSVCFLDDGGNTVSPRWGFWQAYDGSLWAYSITYSATGGRDLIYQFSIDDVGSGTCVTPYLSAPGGTFFTESREQARGITTDPAGDIYVVNSQSFGGPARVTKIDGTTGAVLAQTPLDSAEDGIGYYGAIGLIYVEAGDALYSANYTNIDDCVTRFSLDLQTIQTAVGPTGGASNNTEPVQGKAIGRNKECCPTQNLSISETVCYDGTDIDYFLNEIFSCGDGTVCEGQWSEIMDANDVFDFNDCDLSITVTGIGCANYRLEKTTAASINQACGMFQIDVEICTGTAEATPATTMGTCDAASMPLDDAQINLTAITGDRVAISTAGAASYDGPDYAGATDLAGATIYNFTGLAHSTTYWVRVFNNGDACVQDYEVMTPSINCAGDCDCVDYLYVNEVYSPSNEGRVHKFAIDESTGELTEIQNNGNPWYPGTASSELPLPHGLGVDINGYLYIGEDFNANNAPNNIRRLTCDGTIFPETGPDGFVTPPLGFLLSNVDSYDGFIYANGNGRAIYRFDPCTGDPEGSIQYAGTGSNADWGFYIDDNGRFYITTPEGEVFAFTPTEADFLANTVFSTPIIDLGADPTLGGALSPAYAAAGLQGVTTDSDGNIFIVEGNRDVSGTQSRIIKFDALGNFIVAGPIDANGTDDQGWNQMTGITYSAAADLLYTSSLNPRENCIHQWTTDLLSNEAAIDPLPTTFPLSKAIAINTECCPNQNLSISETVCYDGTDIDYFLNEIFSCGDGTICEGQWTEIMDANNVFDFNDCDLSITVTGNGCATYQLAKTSPAGGNSQCAPFQIDLEICTGIAEATPATTMGTCDAASMPLDDAQINLTAITGDRVAISTAGAASYDGPDYAGATDLAGAATYDFTGLMPNTTYWVRVFVSGDVCTQDYQVMTPVTTCMTDVYSLGSTVFEDLNNNGMQDAGEMGIPGVPVELYNSGGMLIDIGPDGILGTGDDNMGMPYLTDANGNYLFQNLPAGTYQVQIPVSAFGASGALLTLNVSSTPTDTADNEEDGDDNGSQTSAGTVVTSPFIELGEADGEPTGAAEGFQGGMADDGLDDANGDMTVDFGFFQSVSLGDTTFVDANRNGLQDVGEDPVAGITVTLYRADGTPVTMDVFGNPIMPIQTDMNGFYEFTDLPPGDYYVIFDLSTVPGSDFLRFTSTDGGDEANDSDADPNTGQTANTGIIQSGERFPDLDAGVICIVEAEAGTGQTICSTAAVDLTTLGASFMPMGVTAADGTPFGATWSSSGTGAFDDGVGRFGVATTYTPSEADVLAGGVILTLTTDDPSMPPFDSDTCGPEMDEVMIVILKVDCGEFPWDGQ